MFDFFRFGTAVRDPYKNIINMNDLVIVSAGTEELFAFVTEVHNKSEPSID